MGTSSFGLRLRELREQAGLSQAQLAKESGLSHRGISYYEEQRREPTWPAVLAMAVALGVEVQAFCQEPAPRKKAKRGRPTQFQQ